MRTRLQVIATSVEDCIVAEENGADTIELCSALELGGLTPTLGLYIEAKRVCSLPIGVMLRPRPGGAFYNDEEYAVMLADAEAFEEAGAHAFVVAFINDEGEVDWHRCRDLRRQFRGSYLTFHRAFDLLADPFAALASLEGLQFNAVLTSGKEASSLDGAATIRSYVDAVPEWPWVIPAGGVTVANLRQIVEITGCQEIHGSFSKYVDDPSLATLPGYRFGTRDEKLRVLDGELVAAARAILDELEAADDAALL